MTMAHYAILDDENVVVQVITGKDENQDGIDWEVFYSDFTGKRCKRTSYNTVAGIHRLGGIPFRKNYAGIGYTFDEALDAFIPPKPFPSWLLDENTCQWKAPKNPPQNAGFDAQYDWDEAKGDWVSVTQS